MLEQKLLIVCLIALGVCSVFSYLRSIVADSRLEDANKEIKGLIQENADLKNAIKELKY